MHDNRHHLFLLVLVLVLGPHVITIILFSYRLGHKCSNPKSGTNKASSHSKQFSNTWIPLAWTFAGVSLWSFCDPPPSISSYHNESGWWCSWCRRGDPLWLPCLAWRLCGSSVNGSPKITTVYKRLTVNDRVWREYTYLYIFCSQDSDDISLFCTHQ